MKNSFLIILLLLPMMAAAQIKTPVNYKDYMDKVRERNIAYAAEKLNIPIADANIRSARLFNDPTLSLEYANNDDKSMQMGQGFAAELSKTFSPGKIAARVDLARSEKELTAAMLDDFFMNLRAEATIAYLEAIKQSQLYDVRLNSYNSIAELAKADSIKFSLGKITETDAMQSRIEAGIIYNELLQAHSDLHSSYLALNVPLGSFDVDTLYVPQGELSTPSRNFDRAELIEMALTNRSDLVAALRNVDVAQKALKLTRRERNIDFDVALGYNYNTEVRNELAPAPRFNGITVGVGIPLKFSNLNRGAVQGASLQAVQAENHYRQAQLEVQTEVSQNYNAYVSVCSQLEQFKRGVLTEAQAVLEGKKYSYDRGETSLLEVLNAQRTYNEVRTQYIETLFNHCASLVILERSVGVLDVEL